MNWGTDDSSLRVTNEHRDRVLDHINDAYAHGAIDDMERERRTETALLARTRCELDESYRNLPSFKPSVPEGIRTPLPDIPDKRPTTGVGLCGLSALVSGPIGPAVGFALTAQGSWAHSKIKLQLVTQIVFFAFVAGFGISPTGFGLNHRNAGFLSLIWTVVTIVQAVRGFKGQD